MSYNTISQSNKYTNKTKIKNKNKEYKNINKKTKKNKLRKLNQKGGKSKTCWDPNIISPIFFGYPIKK